MSETETKGRAAYEKAREAFTNLEIQDKAAFVVEATLSTFGEAFKDAGRQFAEVIEKVSSEDFFKGFAWECGADSAEQKSSNGPRKPGSRSTSKNRDEDAGD